MCSKCRKGSNKPPIVPSRDCASCIHGLDYFIKDSDLLGCKPILSFSHPCCAFLHARSNIQTTKASYWITWWIGVSLYAGNSITHATGSCQTSIVLGNHSCLWWKDCLQFLFCFTQDLIAPTGILLVAISFMNDRLIIFVQHDVCSLGVANDVKQEPRCDLSPLNRLPSIGEQVKGVVLKSDNF